MADWPTVALASLISATAVCGLLLITFGVAVWRGRHRIVDVAWGLGFVAVAVASYAVSADHGDPNRRLLVLAVVLLWGIRLAGFLVARNWGKPEDPRYEALLARRPGSTWYAFSRIYLTQGAVLWFVSIPVQVAMVIPGRLDWVAAVGVAAWLVGFGFEAVGDAQLAGFKARRTRGEEPSAVLDRGLWRYTRHPNYFGDACVWWGIFLLACSHWSGLFTVLSPTMMTYLLVKRTGKELLERQLVETKPGYRDYMTRTSGFFPLRPSR